MSEPVTIETPITVDELSRALDVKVTDLISELMKNGVMATINDTVDFDTAAVVASDLGIEVTEATQEEEAPDAVAPRAQATVLAEGEGEPRPPVVTVMGHVDHGKTTLLDAFRESNVAVGEAGGITQHISAYQLQHNQRWVTFLDTPGHEAFSFLREHGARLTDVAIVVVAADDGIQPQTEETLRHVREAGVGMVVAINKIDMPDADPNRIKQQLADHNVLPEEWGGDTVVVEISAKQRQNLDGLLDMVFLVADVEDIRARFEGPAEGTIIEAQMVHGKGTVATVLIQHGVLRVGDGIAAGTAHGKVRSLEDFTGARLEQATPSMPVAVSGWKAAPAIGALLHGYKDEKTARSAAETAEGAARSSTTATQADALTAAMQASGVATVPVVIKTDVEGSLTAVTQSLEMLNGDEVKVDIVGSGVGPVSESDVTLAESTGAHIIAFGVNVSGRIKQLAMRANVDIRVYDVIYELIEDIRGQLNELLEPEVTEEVQATLTVKGVFKLAQKEVICGGQVTTGKLVPGLHARFQDGEYIGTVANLQREQQPAKEIIQGEMCGVNIATTHKAKVKEDDELEFFTRESTQRSI